MINLKNIEKQNVLDFNYYGGYDMYTYKFSDDQISIDKTSEKENILNKLKEIDNKYSIATSPTVSDDDPVFEKKTYNPPTDEEIEKLAKESLEEYKNTSLNKIESNFNDKNSKITEKQNELNFEKQEDILDVGAKYETLNRNATNASIKRGLANSSIYEEAIKEIEDSKNAELKRVEKEYGVSISKLESERSILEAQKESALASFDISYAVKLNDEINSINTEINKKKDEVLKYNNQIEKQAAEFKLKKEAELAKQNQELLELVSSKGMTEVNKMKQNEKYEIVKDYLMSLPKQEALNELEDPTYEKQLSNFYTTLYAEMYSRDK